MWCWDLKSGLTKLITTVVEPGHKRDTQMFGFRQKLNFKFLHVIRSDASSLSLGIPWQPECITSGKRCTLRLSPPILLKNRCVSMRFWWATRQWRVSSSHTVVTPTCYRRTASRDTVNFHYERQHWYFTPPSFLPASRHDTSVAQILHGFTQLMISMSKRKWRNSRSLSLPSQKPSLASLPCAEVPWSTLC